MRYRRASGTAQIGEAADEAPDEADRPEEREDEGDRPEYERPQPLRLEPEELVRERRRGRCDDEQLERRPADPLHDVDARREEGATLAERRAHERHPRDACVGPDHPGDREHRVPDQAAHDDCDERGGQGQRRHEDRSGHDDEERDSEIPPQKAGLEPTQHPEARRHRLDAPVALDDLLVIGHSAREAR